MRRINIVVDVTEKVLSIMKSIIDSYLGHTEKSKKH